MKEQNEIQIEKEDDNTGIGKLRMGGRNAKESLSGRNVVNLLGVHLV